MLSTVSILCRLHNSVIIIIIIYISFYNINELSIFSSTQFIIIIINNYYYYYLHPLLSTASIHFK